MNLYTSIKALHVTCVTLSLAGFVLRAAWMMYAPERLARRAVRIVPHVIDTVLLLSGAALAWQLGAAAVAGWLPAKLVGLVVYILLGILALRRGRPPAVRIAATLGALATFGYIVSVAITKDPLGFFSAL